jgi:glycine cleavage system H lipoate-binding protein
MNCPFLREAQVKYCLTSSVRKLIPLAAAGRTDEKCSSAAHATCPVFRMQPSAQMDPQAASAQCPYLGESLMQYCGAAPVAKMVPYSESVLSRCGNSRFRYCELYLALANPEIPAEIDTIDFHDGLFYSANHMWLEVGENGVCHAGMDAFLSRALGEPERVAFVWQSGLHRATAVITVNGVDHDVVFPNPFQITACNLYLRSNPSPIATDPYTGGWLFEGTVTAETTEHLLQGAAARAWMDDELRRISEFLQQSPDPETHYAADGGLFVPGLAGCIAPERMLALFHEFFSPLRGKRDSL